MVLQIWVAYLLDLIFGDPTIIPHPVVIIGKTIDKAEAILRRWVSPVLGDKRAGFLLTLFIVGGTYGITELVLWAARSLHPFLAAPVQVFLIFSCLSVKTLYKVARQVFDELVSKNMPKAREMVGWLVSRDTQNMDEAEVTRAAVESVAENFVDGILSPLFYAFLGGAPLALAYKAINTLDSMVGYKNEKYINFGWVSAKLDDLVNYIPARISGYLLIAVAFLTRRNAKKAFYIMHRDAASHPSPNGGIPESVISGALGIRLGGFNVYGGEKSFRTYMGDPLYPLEPRKILEALEMIIIGSFLALVIGSAVYFLMEQIIHTFAKGNLL